MRPRTGKTSIAPILITGSIITAVTLGVRATMGLFPDAIDQALDVGVGTVGLTVLGVVTVPIGLFVRPLRTQSGPDEAVETVPDDDESLLTTLVRAARQRAVDLGHRAGPIRRAQGRNAVRVRLQPPKTV